MNEVGLIREAYFTGDPRVQEEFLRAYLKPHISINLLRKGAYLRPSGIGTSRLGLA